MTIKPSSYKLACNRLAEAAAKRDDVRLVFLGEAIEEEIKLNTGLKIVPNIPRNIMIITTKGTRVYVCIVDTPRDNYDKSIDNNEDGETKLSESVQGNIVLVNIVNVIKASDEEIASIVDQIISINEL